MYFTNIEYVKNNEYYKPMLQSLKDELEIFNKYYSDDSRFLSGWGHNYFCKEDGGKLIYNIKKPNEHVCSICNKVYRGFEFDSVYITFLRNESVVSLVKSAILYKLEKDEKDEKYLDFIKNIFDFYAENYDRFAIHSKEVISKDITFDVGGAGKIMPQGLNEAIIAIRMINALEIVKEDLSKEWLLEIKTKLFDNIFELLKNQKLHIHNIPCWINSAIGVMGLFFDDKKWIDEATINPFNINEQIAKGVTESGFWYEGSIHYNFFALEGILNFLIFSETYKLKIAEDTKNTVLKMLDSAYRYSFDNDIFPNPSDGWPNVALKTYSYVYYMSYKVFGNVLLKYIKHIEKSDIERPKLPLTEPYYYNNSIPLERILFLPNLSDMNVDNLYERKSESFEAYNCCILRNEKINIFFKYGHQTKSHAHPDKMNVEIMMGKDVLTKDLSNSGYGSNLCNKWHRKNAAHNTCMVNFTESDILSSGKLISYDEKSVKATSIPYEDVLYTRSIQLDKNSINDEFNVTCKENSVIDFFFHLEDEVDKNELTLQKSEVITQYNYILEEHQVICDGKVILKNKLATIEITLERGAQIFLVKTYNNPANTFRDTIIIRKNDRLANFKSVITPYESKE